ncbi:MAG TPA: bifunctional 2-polyprenyl-6-hydroxyphenol methylase/3-demethylubiquinol 3-O-methyltransferase UbiG [Stellaceae bacterium]|jgi:2-polyprenyl-6-hydroxyphenyl methylase / 3-demethylubiquinone-9 3-methyltransferase|nr:bifunctional 2-polyprenyl-6-hydroxyphenol methylase/3-demethylubiquinol 3-O-methyltransferase UbiG [Stellaceae bacterium]
MTPASPSIDVAEVERFSALAETWWDPKGSMAPLHRLNPARLGFLRQTLAAHFGRDARSLSPFDGLRIVDIGCGGGLISEPLARLGAVVTGIDAAEANIAVARAHARGADLEVDYRQASAEELSAAGERFDAVLALEVVEHVADLDAFLAAAAALVRPGGAFIASTLNRTPRSLLFAIVGAEYVLGWLPRGTHRWDRFLKPSELAAALRRRGLQARDIRGLVYDLLAREWRLGRDLGVNYLIFAVRPTG